MITIEDIKQNLGIDISKPNRKVVPVVLKAMYVEMVCNKLKLPIGKLFEKIGNDIKTDRTNIYNLRKKIKYYKLDPATKLIIKAFQTQDKKYIQDYYNYIEKQKQNNNKLFYSYQPVIKLKIKNRMNNLQVATFLKANNDFKTKKYWDVHLEKYTDNDWLSLRAINPKMFDSVVNN